MLLFPVGSLVAAPGVECELAIYQADPARDSANTLLFIDTAKYVQGIRATGFFVAFSIELEFTAIDSDRVTLNAHVATLAPSSNHYSRQFKTDLGLPARLERIIGKNNTRYTLVVRPIRRVEIDTAACNMVHYRKSDFKFDPSANLDIYFVPQSAGDFYWNAVKGLMEERYRQFAEINKFNLPGKYLLYLCPCPIYSVIWDDRFGMMVDPTRNTAFALYSTSYNAADPYLMMYISLARHYGYAPQFLMEGFAGYLSLANFDMKEIVAQKNNVPLASLLSTRTYLTTEPQIADRMSASFVRFLIDQEKIDQFLRLYRAADDLNLLATMEQTYGATIAQLEAQWLHYVDTVTFRPEVLGQYADQAEAMFDYKQVERLRSAQLAKLTDSKDSIGVIAELAQISFFQGKYEQAVGWQQRLVELDSARQIFRMTLGAYQLMAGKYDAGHQTLLFAQKMDTVSNPLVTFNLALSYLIRGDTATCRKMLTDVVKDGREGVPFLEPRATLMAILMPSRDENDRHQAITYANEMLNVLNQTSKSATSTPTVYLWTGIAMLGKEDTSNANDQVISAIFLETRPFYQGLGYLWLGKLADLRGERAVAKGYYKQVQDLPSAKYHQSEANRLMEHPYRQ
jgi:Flp pilus assembly protein TadD